MGHPTAQGPGWWQASDGHWYPPHQHPSATLTPPTRLGAASAGSVLGNVLWLVLAGWWLSIGYLVAGVASCLTVIGIPFGLQSFKLAGYALWPFGRMVVDRPQRGIAVSFLGNVVWFVLGGVWLALGHLIAGALLCVTIVGIPLGLASIKMAGLALAPFGKHVVRRAQLTSMTGATVVMSVR